MKITIIVPVYNEKECIRLFYNRLLNVVNKINLSEKIVEILFVDNNSTDGSYEVIKELAAIDKKISLIKHSRNFGYQASIISGINHAKGDQIIFIDVDGEDPPELITQMIKIYETGEYDLVYGVRNNRDENCIISMLRKLFYRISKHIADSEFIIDMAEFAMISERIKEVVLKNNTTFPFVRNEFSYSGFKSYGLAYRRNKRSSGKTKYNLFGMFSFALAGVLTFSTFPLRFVSYIGLLMFVLFPFLLIFIDKEYIVIILTALIYLFSSISLPIFSLYISRIYKDIVRRPLYIVDYKKSII